MLSFPQEKLFKEGYLRNNRQGGIKNIRCFPCCNPHSHSEFGFCGRPVIVEVKFKADAIPDLRCAYFVGEFKPSCQPNAFVNPMNEKELIQKSKMKFDSSPPYYLGEIIAQEFTTDSSGVKFKTLTINMNFYQKVFNYAWSSNRYVAKVTHVFEVSMLVNLKKDGILTLCESVCSPSFQISSVRRSKPVVFRNPNFHTSLLASNDARRDDPLEENLSDSSVVSPELIRIKRSPSFDCYTPESKVCCHSRKLSETSDTSTETLFDLSNSGYFVKEEGEGAVDENEENEYHRFLGGESSSNAITKDDDLEWNQILKLLTEEEGFNYDQYEFDFYPAAAVAQATDVIAGTGSAASKTTNTPVGSSFSEWAPLMGVMRGEEGCLADWVNHHG